MLWMSLALTTPALAESPPPSSAPTSDAAESPSALLKRRTAELTVALREYRDSLDRLLAMHEQALARAVERQRTWRDLYDHGTISRRELETGEQAVQTAQGKVDETRREIDAADHATAEAVAMEALAALPPPAPGEHQQTPALLRYQGRVIWSLPTLVPKLQQLFATHFSRSLPISALGQTALHDRLGFDHRNAMDVAVYPDSPEGKALIEYLQAEGIPFIAYRGAVPGSSSGAHVHVGQPSPRTTVATDGPPHRR
jgi:hypothetical protein